jgi:hypothetical protein
VTLTQEWLEQSARAALVAGPLASETAAASHTAAVRLSAAAPTRLTAGVQTLHSQAHLVVCRHAVLRCFRSWKQVAAPQVITRVVDVVARGVGVALLFIEV